MRTRGSLKRGRAGAEDAHARKLKTRTRGSLKCVRAYKGKFPFLFYKGKFPCVFYKGKFPFVVYKGKFPYSTCVYNHKIFACGARRKNRA